MREHERSNGTRVPRPLQSRGAPFPEPGNRCTLENVRSSRVACGVAAPSGQSPPRRSSLVRGTPHAPVSRLVLSSNAYAVPPGCSDPFRLQQPEGHPVCTQPARDRSKKHPQRRTGQELLRAMSCPSPPSSGGLSFFDSGDASAYARRVMTDASHEQHCPCGGNCGCGPAATESPSAPSEAGCGGDCHCGHAVRHTVVSTDSTRGA